MISSSIVTRSRRAAAIVALALVVAASVACRRAPPEGSTPTPPPTDDPGPPLLGELDPGDGAGARPPATPTTPEPIVDLPAGTDLTLVHDGPAWAALTMAGAVVILEEDFLQVRMIDAETGAARWRVAAQERPNGRHSLYRAGDRIFLHAGPRLIALEASTGRIVGESSGPFNGNDMGCRFEAAAGACAHVCDCLVLPVDCRSGATLGPGWRSDESHLYHDLSAGHDTVCFKPPRLIGGAGELTLIVHSEGGTEVVAVDRRGEPRWRSQATAAGIDRVDVAGASPDGALCWIGEAGGGALRLFRCADGAVLGTMSKSTGEIRRGDTRGLAGDQLWIVRSGPRGGFAAVHEGSRAIWRQALAADTFAIPLGGRVDAVIFGRPQRLRVLDPKSGKEVFALDLGDHDALLDDRGRGYVRSGDDLQELDERGQLRRRRPRALRGLAEASAGHFVVRDGPRIEVLRREDLTPALRLDGLLSQLDGEPVSATGLVFLLHRGDRPARLVVLR